jgi:hypothetical protein
VDRVAAVGRLKTSKPFPRPERHRETAKFNGSRLQLELKNVRKDGTHALLLEPHDLLVRLCACIPPPWFNLIRYFGVLSSHSRHRARVVPPVVDPSRLGKGQSG